MFSKYYISFKKIKPIDFLFFIGINLACGLYIWSPYLKEFYTKPNSTNNNQIETVNNESQSENINQKQKENENEI